MQSCTAAILFDFKCACVYAWVRVCFNACRGDIKSPLGLDTLGAGLALGAQSNNLCCPAGILWLGLVDVHSGPSPQGGKASPNPWVQLLLGQHTKWEARFSYSGIRSLGHVGSRTRQLCPFPPSPTPPPPPSQAP